MHRHTHERRWRRRQRRGFILRVPANRRLPANLKRLLPLRAIALDHDQFAKRMGVLHRGLLQVTHDAGWQLEAWAVFSNHDHFVAHSPEDTGDASSLSRMLGALHEKMEKWVNRLDHQKGAKFGSIFAIRS